MSKKRLNQLIGPQDEVCAPDFTHETIHGILENPLETSGQHPNGAPQCISPSLQERKNIRLTSAKDAVVSKRFSLRAAARFFDIPWPTFRRYYQKPVPSSTRTGPPHALTMAEETIILSSAIDFAQNGTTLSRESVRDLIQHFCQHLPLDRQNVHSIQKSSST